MNMKRFMAAVLVLIAAVACRNHERSMVVGSYGSGTVTGQVYMDPTVGNSSPAGVEVSVQGTGMAMVLGADGRFAFTNVPETAVLHFRRAADGIDASMGVSAASVAVELSATTARTTSSRRRTAPITPLLQFEGTIKEVGADFLIVTTSHKTEVKVMLAPETVIRHGQTAIAAADLKVDDRVHVKTSLNGDVYTATEVIVQNQGEDGGDEAQTVTANGLVASVGTTDMVVHTADGRDITVQVDDQTLIRRYGQPIQFSDIKVGDHVEARGTRVDDTTIKAVQIQVEDGPGLHGTVVLDGSVVSTDSTAGTLTVHTATGDFTVNTDSSTSIKKRGKSISLADVHTGDEVTVKGSRVDATTILADSIQVH